jgi:transcription antitermination factor NusG
MDGEPWYVVAVEPQAEGAVTRRASEIAITAYYPTGKHMVKRGRVRVVEFAVDRPAIPGYVFVYGRHFANFRRDYDAPDAVPRCLGWLTGADGPEPVAPVVIDDLMQRAADGEFDALARQSRYWAPRWIRAGAKVRIIEGAFKGMVGEIWRVTAKQRVAIWVMLMGRLTLAECAVDSVARAEKTVARGPKANYA